jgi:hypothetical protein
MKKETFINIKGIITGMICAICLFATSQGGLKAQTIRFNGGSCVQDTIVKIRQGFARVDFKYTLDEDARADTLRVLLDQGQLLAGSRKYKAAGIVFEADEQGGISTKKNGTVSLTFFIPDNVKVESLKFVLPEQELLSEYIAFQKANPNYLDGIWSGEKKRALNTFSMQYTISGNKMLFEGKSKHANRSFTAEGQMYYNENTIILIPGKATVNGKEIENFSKQPKYIWHYTVTGNALRLEGGRLFSKGGLIWENTGEFHKTILQE